MISDFRQTAYYVLKQAENNFYPMIPARKRKTLPRPFGSIILMMKECFKERRL